MSLLDIPSAPSSSSINRKTPDYGSLGMSTRSHESLTAAANHPPPTRSFSMAAEIPFSPSTVSFHDYGLSPANYSRKRPSYIRHHSTITPFNVMSDDEKEKRGFEPTAKVSSRGEIRETSTKETMVLRKRDERADVVKGMVENSKLKCNAKEKRIKELEGLLNHELSRSRDLTATILETGQLLSAAPSSVPTGYAPRRQGTNPQVKTAQHLAYLLKYNIPQELERIKKTRAISKSVQRRVAVAKTELEKADATYDKFQRKASALEQHLQWRTTPWYTKARAYLRGERKLNWYDTSAHRTQALAQITSWLLITIAGVAAIVCVVATWFYYHRL